jgi:hypothetical protein
VHDALDGLNPTLLRDGEANARLIAATPELLEACHIAASALAKAQDGIRPDYEDLETVLQAIVKAEGE